MTNFKEVISTEQIIKSFIESIQYQAQFIKNNDINFFNKYQKIKNKYKGIEQDLKLSHLLHNYYFLNMDTGHILDVLYNDDISEDEYIASVINSVDDDDLKYILNIIQNFEDYSDESLFELIDEYMNI